MGLGRNVASQKWMVFAFDRGSTPAGAPKTGDAANITAKIRKDYGAATATNDVNPVEIEDGYYEFDLLQAETDADVLDLLPDSSTSNIVVVGVPGRIFTVPEGFFLSQRSIVNGTVDNTAFTPTTTQFEADDITEATADHFKDGVVYWTAGANIGKRKPITAYALVGGRGKFTVSTMAEAPANNDTFVIL